MRKFLGVIMGAILAMGVMVGCGQQQPNYFTPTAFGANSQCYYWSHPYEAQSLIRQHLCQSSWVPAPMPLLWRQRYYNYYSSPEYVNYYVRPADRVVYRTSMSSFGRSYATQIRTQAKFAKYISSDGTKTTGDRVPRGSFGGGVRTRGGNGVRVCALGAFDADTLIDRGGFGSSGGGFGGGSRGGFSGGSRSGSFGSGSKGSFGGGTKTYSGKGFSGGGKSYSTKGVTRGGC